MTDDRWTGEFFDEKYAEADPWDFETSRYEQTKYRRQLRTIHDHVPEPDSILEIGCAEGVFTEMLLSRFETATVTGVDISEQAVERARDRVDDHRATFVAGDAIEYLGRVGDTYDVIVWSETIYYMGDRMSVRAVYEYVEAVAERLDPGGVLCMANIVDQPEGEEAPLTRRPVQECYHKMLAHVLNPVHRSNHIERKTGVDEPLEYEIWGFQRR